MNEDPEYSTLYFDPKKLLASSKKKLAKRQKITIFEYLYLPENDENSENEWILKHVIDGDLFIDEIKELYLFENYIESTIDNEKHKLLIIDTDGKLIYEYPQ